MTTDLDVCVCTYRRPSVIETIRSIAQQVVPASTRIRLVVIDNDDTPTARDLVLAECARLGLACTFRHAPARNISLARNAALDAAGSNLVAFIDDDEIAPGEWLAALLARREATGATVVFGRVVAVYPVEPAWLRAADLHSVRPVVLRGGLINTGYTCNVLLDRGVMTQAMIDLRFDLALGQSGGEDTFFFHALFALGARLTFAEEAVLHEDVPPHRRQLRWLMKRSFRSGQTHGRVLLTGTAWHLRLLTVAAAKCIACAAECIVSSHSPARWRRAATRAALHAGVVSRLVGRADLQLY